ncbi:MAG: hypothetical protein ACPG7F_09445 [Aggregatilineales bacterium]
MDKQKRKDTPLTFRQKYWLPIFAARWALFCTVLFIITFPQAHEGYDVFYPVILNGLPRTIFFIVFAGMVHAYAVIVLVLIFWQLYRLRDYKLTAITLVVSSIGFIASIVAVIAIGVCEVQIHHRAVINAHVYYVASPGTFSNSHYTTPRIYECDTFQIRCSEVEFARYRNSQNVSEMSITSTSEKIIIGEHIFRPD